MVGPGTEGGQALDTVDARTVTRRRLPRDLSRQRIVAAAAVMFRDRALSEASIGDLAAGLSMTSANVYRHFSSKRDLANAVCALHAGQALDRLLRSVACNLPPDRLIETVVLENLRYNRENFRDAPHTVALLRTAAIEQWPGFTQMGTGLTRIVADLVERGMRDGTFRSDLPPDTAGTVMMALKSVMHPVLLDEIAPDDLEAEAARMISLLMQALRPA